MGETPTPQQPPAPAPMPPAAVPVPEPTFRPTAPQQGQQPHAPLPGGVVPGAPIPGARMPGSPVSGTPPRPKTRPGFVVLGIVTEFVVMGLVTVASSVVSIDHAAEWVVISIAIRGLAIAVFLAFIIIGRRTDNTAMSSFGWGGLGALVVRLALALLLFGSCALLLGGTGAFWSVLGGV